jgi:hypothetical protein
MCLEITLRNMIETCLLKLKLKTYDGNIEIDPRQ